MNPSTFPVTRQQNTLKISHHEAAPAEIQREMCKSFHGHAVLGAAWWNKYLATVVDPLGETSF